MNSTRHITPLRDAEIHVDTLPLLRRVVAVCAHPDDESFGLGAVIATLVEQDTIVEAICLTRGEASTLHIDDGPLDQRRHAELLAATDELGIDRLELADFPDGALASAAAAELHRFIHPIAQGADALLVFDEGGITGHPDHQAATHAALAVADDLDIPVLAWALPAAVARALNDELGTGFVGRDPDEIDLRVRVERTRQLRAMACHDSQLADNPVPMRRLELTGDIECLRYLRRPSVGTTPGSHT
jgi:LmbE family N-acetylglucosaminyl deacetylase